VGHSHVGFSIASLLPPPLPFFFFFDTADHDGHHTVDLAVVGILRAEIYAASISLFPPFCPFLLPPSLFPPFSSTR